MEVILNELQQSAYEQAVRRYNIFVSGSGGVGKSTWLKYLYTNLSQTRRIGLTSMTGISANLIGGQTLHSLLGIRLGTGTPDELYSIISNQYKLNVWRDLDVLVIDEVSMLNPELFDKLEQLGRMIRGNEEPFGGIQLILCGDLLQLPVVKCDKFCFEADCWDTCIDRVIILKEIVRQSDVLFCRVLNKIRLGMIDDECKEIIGARQLKFPADSDILPTRLCAINAKVDRMNQSFYSKLEGTEYTYEVAWTWKVKLSSAAKTKYEKTIQLPPELKLKVGAQVIHLINEGNLFNGSRGVVKSFIQGYPIVQFKGVPIPVIITRHTCNIEDKGQTVGTCSQVPLKLAWGMSIHKSQGSTLDLVHIDMDNIFEYGQFYTALSRVKTLDGLYIKNLNWNLVKTHPKALEFYMTLEDSLKTQ